MRVGRSAGAAIGQRCRRAGKERRGQRVVNPLSDLPALKAITGMSIDPLGEVVLQIDGVRFALLAKKVVPVVDDQFGRQPAYSLRTGSSAERTRTGGRGEQVGV